MTHRIRLHNSAEKVYLDTFDMTVTGKATYLYKNWLDTTM